MPSFQDCKLMLGGGLNTTGRQHLYESMDIIEATWYDDPASTTAYFYSYEYDDEIDKCVGLNPEKSKTKIPVDIKYLVSQYQSVAKDQVDYRIMFKPDYKCNIPYYQKLFADKCHSEYPVGLYCDIKDEKGIWRKWLVVAEANKYNRDFPNWSILPCTYRYCWIYKGKKYQMWGVPRSQSS